MKLELAEIPNVAQAGDYWKLRALGADGKFHAINILAEWKRREPSDFKKIVKAMQLGAKEHRVHSPNHVKQCTQGYPLTYEFRAHRGSARLMFFYDEKRKLIVCTNSVWKGADNQNNAFRICDLFRQQYDLDPPPDCKTDEP